MKYINQVKRLPDKEDLAFMEQEKANKMEAESFEVDKSSTSLMDVENKLKHKDRNKGENVKTTEEVGSKKNKKTK